MIIIILRDMLINKSFSDVTIVEIFWCNIRLGVIVWTGTANFYEGLSGPFSKGLITPCVIYLTSLDLLNAK